MIVCWINVVVNNSGNNIAASFFYVKSLINTFFIFITQTLKYLSGLILQTGRQLGGAFLNDNDLEIWKSDKCHKPKKYYTIQVWVMVTPIIKQIVINAVVGIVVEINMVADLFLNWVMEK